ncbi:MAG: NUDIX domain-containing protein [Acidimicrobiia bacterium]|nr:NUDIX domain-containing protein [Acidimicrobiia bacterium]
MVDRVRAGAVIVDGGRLAVIERDRDGHHYFTLPGGGVEDGETVEEAAAREVLEELGVEVELLGTVGAVTLTRGSWVTLQIYFAARSTGGIFGAGTRPGVPAGPRPDDGYLPADMARSGGGCRRHGLPTRADRAAV